MSRKEWQKVLDSEVKRWSAMSCGQLVSELHEVQAYEVEFESKQYQVEVELLENTEKYLHVMVAVRQPSDIHLTTDPLGKADSIKQCSPRARIETFRVAVLRLPSVDSPVTIHEIDKTLASMNS